MFGGRNQWYIAAAVALAAVVALVLHANLLMQGREERRGLVIAVTFSSLLDDVRALLCEGDEVFSVAPSGVDPHDYVLTPQDVEKLRNSNVIVSTAHTPFEVRISELVARREINARLIEIPAIAGLRIRENPATGLPNYHGIILDPFNYITFVRNLTAVLVELRPACSASYREKAAAIEAEVERLVARAPRLNATAVAMGPLAQYAVEWMGIRVKYLLVREHDLPAVPEDITAAERALATGEASIVVTIRGAEDTPLGAKALELARKYGKPMVPVPTMIEPGSTLSKIADVISEVEKALQAAQTSVELKPQSCPSLSSCSARTASQPSPHR